MWEGSLWERMSTKALSHRRDVSTFALVQGAGVRSLVVVRGHPAPTFQGGTVSCEGTTCTCEKSLPLYIYVDTHIRISICLHAYRHAYTRLCLYTCVWSKLPNKIPPDNVEISC